jgi:hypothetical protein
MFPLIEHEVWPLRLSVGFYNERKLARESEARAQQVMNDKYYGLLHAVKNLDMGAFGEHKRIADIREELGLDD